MQDAKNYRHYVKSASDWRRPCQTRAGALRLRLRGLGERWRPKPNAKRLPRRSRSARMARLPNETWSTSSAQIAGDHAGFLRRLVLDGLATETPGTMYPGGRPIKV
jgi:hypothetical protein